MELGKKILRGFQNALEYLRDFTISERIPYTLPLQHSADSELWGVCVHDDAHVSYLKKNHEQPQHQQVQSNAGFLDTYWGVV